jgi:hypothetical protein
VKESLKTKIYKFGFNLFPAFRGTGGKVTFISGDFKEIHLKLPLNWRTKNYVGTIYGGSMYGSIDPIYMFMLLKTLGKQFIIWDKAASIRFIKPGRTTLYAKFTLSDTELSCIKQELNSNSKIDRVYQVELVDKDGVVYAKVDKTLHIRQKAMEPKNINKP